MCLPVRLRKARGLLSRRRVTLLLMVEVLQKKISSAECLAWSGSPAVSLQEEKMVGEVMNEC